MFIVVGLVQAFGRAGFDLRDHTLSLLSNGRLGWVQIASFVVCGGLFTRWERHGSRSDGGTGSDLGPRLITAFGAGMVAADAFLPDPAYGFPPGNARWKAGLGQLAEPVLTNSYARRASLDAALTLTGFQRLVVYWLDEVTTTVLLADRTFRPARRRRHVVAIVLGGHAAMNGPSAGRAGGRGRPADNGHGDVSGIAGP